MKRTWGSLVFSSSLAPIKMSLQCTLYNVIPCDHTSLTSNLFTSPVVRSSTSEAYSYPDLEPAGKTFEQLEAQYIRNFRLPVSLWDSSPTDEAQFCMQEAVDTLRTPHQLRTLFIHLLTNSCISTPLQFWNEFRLKISEDFILTTTGDVEQGCNEALRQLGFFLQGHGKHLDDYGLPQPLARDDEAEWELRRWLPQATVLQQQVDVGMSAFNFEQRDIFLRVQHAISHDEPLLVFVDGKAGRGKTFLVNTLCAWV